MEKKSLNIEELSQYLGIKKFNLYPKVERREIPFYKWGRLIMFDKEEIARQALVLLDQIIDIDDPRKALKILTRIWVSHWFW